MVCNYGPFYKVVVLAVDMFETEIVDEQNFANKESADELAHQWSADDNVTLVIYCH